MTGKLPKLKLYDGRDFTSTVLIQRKLDGVQATLYNGEVVSRKGKPLHNIPANLLQEGVSYEVYCGNFDDTISLVRTHEADRTVREDELYSLTADNKRLFITELNSLNAAEIDYFLKLELSFGNEGLVLHEQTPKGIRLWKVKPNETYDVRVTGIQPGRKKNLGKMGALLTTMGKVGTGFTDAQRESFNEDLIGTIIEVECMKLTTKGVFRHARFVRLRPDKDTENRLT